MKYAAILTLVTLCSPTVFAADTFSRASLYGGYGQASEAQGRGDWVRARTQSSPHYSNGTVQAIDPHSVSFSTSTAIRSGRYDAAASTLNITVGPGYGSSSAGYARGQGCGSTASGHGRSQANHSMVEMRASGDTFSATGQANSTPYYRNW